MLLSDIKEQIKSIAIRGVNATGLSSKYIGSPRGMLSVEKWVEKFGKRYDAKFIPIYPSIVLNEPPPTTLEPEVHQIYSNEYKHEIPQAFIATIPGARVWGKNGTVIAPNDFLLTDVSREFGAYGGITGKEHSINKQLLLHKCTKIKGNIAIIGTAGTYNYHHWLFDSFTRIHLLKTAGYFDQIDFFILDYTGSSFQKESLRLAGIPEDKIINANDNWKFHVEVENLFIPSLPSRLARIGIWPMRFLRDTFLISSAEPPQRLYISRRKAPSRKLINEEEIIRFLTSKGFVEFFPEEHSIVETAARFSKADFIIGVHGSGFANLAFISEGTKVIDIVAPLHLDPYYWMLTNRNNGKYGYIFGKGERAEENRDLVASKIDKDISIDLEELKTLFKII